MRSLGVILGIALSAVAGAQAPAPPTAPAEVPPPAPPAAPGEAAPPEAAPAPSPPLGRFSLADGEAVDAADRAAVDVVLSALHPNLRDPFRAELLSILRAPRSLELVRDGEGIAVVADGQRTVVPLDGTSVRAPGPAGRSINVSCSIVDGALVVVAETGNFRRAATLRQDADGLSVEVSLRSRLLPRPLTSTARYTPAP